MGLLAEGSGVAANALKILGIDLQTTRRELDKIVQPGPLFPKGKLLLSPRTKKAIEHAIEESRALGHNYVGTEHLLLGLVHESEGVAAQVLINLGLALEDVRQTVFELVNQAVLDLLIQSVPLTEADAATDSEEPDARLQHLPAAAREILAEFDCQIDVLAEEKAEAFKAHDFEKAARLRDLEDKLKKLRTEFVDQWKDERPQRE